MPPSFAVGSSTRTRFREALTWFKAALLGGVHVPHAPRLVFPQPGNVECAFTFVDASREWGIGGWTLIAGPKVTFFSMEFGSTLPGSPQGRTGWSSSVDGSHRTFRGHDYGTRYGPSSSVGSSSNLHRQRSC